MCYTFGMAIYMGTWQTSASDGFWTDQDLSQSEKVLSLAIKSGIRGFDCAQSYGHGQAEQTLGKILRRHPDTPFAVDTKIMPTTKDPKELVAQSVRRLGRQIDCLYLHWPRTGFDNKAFISRMAELKNEGLISKVGVCNMPFEGLQQCISEGIEVDRIQRPMSLLWSRGYAQCANYCREKGIEISVYSPSGMGLLSGKYRSEKDLKDARGTLFCFRESSRRQFLQLLDLLSEISKAHSTTNTKIALKWTAMHQPDIMILGARTEAQLRENLERDIVLTQSEFDSLTAASEELDKSARDVRNIFSYDF